jgi:hypothetical protein
MTEVIRLLPNGIQTCRISGNLVREPDFPNSLTDLRLSGHFSCSLPRLPVSLKTLSLNGYNFPIPSGLLPSGLEVLKLRTDFNIGRHQKILIVGKFGAKIRKLKLRGNLDIYPGLLPNSLTELKLDRFDSVLEPGVLPQSLQKLTLTNHFRTQQVIPVGLFPSELQFLRIHNWHHAYDEHELPLAPSFLTLEALSQFQKDGRLSKDTKIVVK